VLTQKKNGKGTVYFVDENSMIISKKCTKCDEVKALDAFCARKSGLGGRDATCKACAVKRSIERYKADKGPALERSRKQQEIKRQSKEIELGPIPKWRCLEGKRNRVWVVYYENKDGEILAKACTKCDEVKTLDQYAVLKIGLGGRVSDCKCCRARDYENNRESEVERVSKWQRDNREKATMQQQRRRARVKSLPDCFTEQQVSQTLTFFGGCVLTGEKTDIHWDHVIPLATGTGGTIHGNMVPLRGDLNISKSDENIFEWFSRNKARFTLSQTKFDRLINWLSEVNEMTIEEYRNYVYQCFENSNELGSHSA
jgi:hypothetical protein